MNTAQLLRRLPEAPPPIEESRFTSGALEEDFDDAIKLLLATPRFLEFLRDADKHFDFLGNSAKAALADHIEAIEEFTGQWPT